MATKVLNNLVTRNKSGENNQIKVENKMCGFLTHYIPARATAQQRNMQHLGKSN